MRNLEVNQFNGKLTLNLLVYELFNICMQYWGRHDHRPPALGVIVNLLAHGSCDCNLELIIFKLISKDRYYEHFPCNCPQVNVTGPHWCLVNIDSINASSHYHNRCWPWSVMPYGITRLQWVNLNDVRMVYLLSLHQKLSNPYTENIDCVVLADAEWIIVWSD